MMKSGGSNVIQMTQQREQTPSLLVVPHLCKSDLIYSDSAETFLQLVLLT